MYKNWRAKCYMHLVYFSAFYFSLPVYRHNQCLCCVQREQLSSSGLPINDTFVLFFSLNFFRIKWWNQRNNTMFTYCYFLSASSFLHCINIIQCSKLSKLTSYYSHAPVIFRVVVTTKAWMHLFCFALTCLSCLGP